MAFHRGAPPALSASALALLLFLGLLPSLAGAQIRMVEVDENALEVTIKNFSTTTTFDVSGYQMCRQPGTYQALSALTIVGGGDLDLSPGEEVTLVYSFILPAGTGIGLYIDGSNFSNPNNMADYVQYKGVVGFREPVAVSAGIWSAGSFASGDPGPYFYTGDGTQNGAAFWTNSPPAPSVPVLGAWLGTGLLVAMLLCVGRLAPRRSARPPLA